MTSVNLQHWAAIRTCAPISFLSTGCTKLNERMDKKISLHLFRVEHGREMAYRGENSDGAIIVATLCLDILLHC